MILHGKAEIMLQNDNRRPFFVYVVFHNTNKYYKNLIKPLNLHIF